MRRLRLHHGDERTVRRFLWFPTTLRIARNDNSHKMWRWLEYAEIRQFWGVYSERYINWYWTDIPEGFEPC